METSGSQKVCVVLDTNIWRSERLLNSPKARALVYMLLRRDGVLALPEVVENELPAVICRVGMEANRKAVQASREVRDLLDDAPAANEYSESDFLQAVGEKLRSLEAVLKRIPLTIDTARAALGKVYAKQPPNQKEEQFRDSVIWQTAVGLAREYEVHFVTNDNAFFEQANGRGALAQQLSDDCERECIQVRVHRDVATCLKSLKVGAPKFDEDAITSTLIKDSSGLIDSEAEREKVRVVDTPHVSIEAFELPVGDRVAIDFTIEVDCMPTTPCELARGKTCVMTLLGGCYCSLADMKISEVFYESSSVICEGQSGRRSSSRIFGLRDPKTPIVRPDLLL